jgi:hypothetical protein
VLGALREFRPEALVPPKPLIKDLETSAQAKRNWPHNLVSEEMAIVVSRDQEKVEEIREKVEEIDAFSGVDSKDALLTQTKGQGAAAAAAAASAEA